VRWYLAAAEGGHGLAGYKLAFAYLRGRGASGKDHALAYAWFSVSAERGVGDAAEWRDRVAAKMTEREREEAERFLSEWRAGE
jgi:TPR repeat protein